MEITTVELFEEFCRSIKACDSTDEIYQEYGGSCIYVPSYKSTKRNKHIFRDMKQGLKDGKSMGSLVRELSKKYDLTVNRIYAITKDVRQLSLFDD